LARGGGKGKIRKKGEPFLFARSFIRRKLASYEAREGPIKKGREGGAPI